MSPAKSSEGNLIAKLKTEMVNYFGPIFQELKGDFRELKGGFHELRGDVQELKGDVQGLKGDVQELKGDVQGLKGDVHELTGDVHNLKGLKGETHRLGILMEDMRNEVRLALEASSSVLGYEETVKDHEGRIDDLEKDVRTLKTIRPSKL